MSNILGKNVILYTQGEEESITVDVEDNLDGTQTVTVTWAATADVLASIGYNDGSWHDTIVANDGSASITIPTGSYTYRLKIGFNTYSPLPTTFLAWQPYACGRNVSITVTTDFIETSVSGTGINRTYKPTANSWAGAFDGIVAFDETGMLSLADLRLKQSLQELLTVKIETTDEDGNVLMSETGTAYIANSEYTGDYNDIATFSIELRGTTELTQGES